MLKDRAILLLALGETFIWAGLYYVFPATLVRWEADLGWSRGELTLAITLAVLVSAVAAPFMGRVIDRGFGAVLMGAAAAVGGVLLIALSQITQLWQFYAIWLLIGVCLAGSLYEPCFAIVTRARGMSAKRGITAITLVAGLAGTVSFPSVHFLAEAVGWRLSFILIGSFVVFFVAPILWLGVRLLGNETVSTVEQRSGPRRAPRLLAEPVFWGLGLAFALLAVVHGATLHHLLPMLGERGVEANFAVFAAASIGPMQVVGRLLMLATDAKFSHRAFSLIAFGIMALSVAILWASGAGLAGIGMAVILFGSAYGMVSILRPLLARDLLGEADFGSKSGLLALLYLTASATSAWFGSFIWSLGGYDVMLLVLLVFAGSGALLFEITHRRVRNAAGSRG